MPISTAQTLKDFYEALLAAYGPQGWWPGDTPTEIVIGAILTQNTNWQNVERAIVNLRSANLIDFAALHEITAERLAELIRPAGYYNVKAKRLKNFARWLCERYQGDLARLREIPLHQLREELLSVNGIGRETADSILCYALELPTFVVDAYTARIAQRHNLIDEGTGYEDLKSLFQDNLPDDVTLFNEYHALIVAVAKKHCRTKPICAKCPLERFPHSVENPEMA